MSLNDFLELTPAQTLDVRQKYIEKENQLSRERWELARWQVLKTKADIKGRGGYISLRDIERFPWEQPAETEKSTEEKFRKAVARYN